METSGGRRPKALHGWRPKALRDGTDPDPRFTLANERTFLAWVRTALGVIAAAVALETFAGGIVSEGLRTVLACALLGFAAVLMVFALIRWHRVEHAMRTGRALPVPWVAYLLAVALGVSGVVLAVAIAR
ncbi:MULTISPECIES: YidH family protein [Rhodococcus]|uniref:YidH family protein n=1 Tax=Rhodococcus TaxID=1827 RepID=UPI001E31C0CD|nr:DUF202 domain-containing protein [Rhodococcus pyridinivorans]MCD2116447.1 DUF202 domain-containing protein [Rhodococcus pyridinivorans]MCZ4625315.1 DUF202 domain-containing protein [Rhodococcus pyridinivorans]MCZ4646166.1 DUF202 domain-containing protein [Rhodococcus pyridinivorans]MDJ0484482.1 DUF202 domain-containing protein [Rhodococcus pyridinivorans]MDV7252628.1 DUF202 domain-containing protein [Rhodococcus pyridinivorans]